jgi:hypothetical protein
LTGRDGALGLGWFNVRNIARGVFGLVAGFATMIVVSLMGRQPSAAKVALLDDLRAPHERAFRLSGRHRQPASPRSATGLPVWPERRIVMCTRHVIRGLKNNPERGRSP